jgi:hypothetical protein
MNPTQAKALEILERVLQAGGVWTTPMVMKPLIETLESREWTGTPRLLAELILTEHGYDFTSQDGGDLVLRAKPAR